MAISVGRAITEEERQLMDERAKSFAVRHGIDDVESARDIEIHIDSLDAEERSKLNRLWRAVLRRISNGYTEYGFGYWGQHVS